MGDWSTRSDKFWHEACPDGQRNNKKEEIANWDEEKTVFREARQKRGFFEVSPEDTNHLMVISNAPEKLDNCMYLAMSCIPKEECSEKLAAQPICQRTGILTLRS